MSKALMFRFIGGNTKTISSCLRTSSKLTSNNTQNLFLRNYASASNEIYSSCKEELAEVTNEFNDINRDIKNFLKTTGFSIELKDEGVSLTKKTKSGEAVSIFFAPPNEEPEEESEEESENDNTESAEIEGEETEPEEIDVTIEVKKGEDVLRFDCWTGYNLQVDKVQFNNWTRYMSETGVGEQSSDEEKRFLHYLKEHIGLDEQFTRVAPQMLDLNACNGDMHWLKGIMKFMK